MESRLSAGAWGGSSNRASVRAASRSSRVSKTALAKTRRNASNQRSAGLSSGRQGDLLNAVGPADLAAGVATAVVEHEPDFVGAGVLAHLLQEALEAEPVDVRQEQHDAGSAHRLDRGIEPEPMVLMLMDPGRAAAERAPQPAVCHLQTEPGLVHGEDPLHREPRHRGLQLIF